VNVQSLTDCAVPAGATESVDGLLALDAQARHAAQAVVTGLAR
jgi:hypothetical protein